MSTVSPDDKRNDDKKPDYLERQIERDQVLVADTHYNAMRQKPMEGVAFLENNIHLVRPFPNTWLGSDAIEARLTDRERRMRTKQYAKRCLFDTGTVLNDPAGIHLRSIDSLTNRHMLNDELWWPQEDTLYKELGHKRRILDSGHRRNGLAKRAPGDNTYKVPEYSSQFFYKVNRNWRSEKYDLESMQRRRQEQMPDDLIKLLHLDDYCDDAGASTGKKKKSSLASLFSSAQDFDYEHDAKQQLLDEIQNVRELDAWQAAPRLTPAFKVLDLDDKAPKYRPRVNK